MRRVGSHTQQLLRGYEAHLKFFNIQDEEEIFNMFVVRDELLSMELSPKEKEKFNELENKLKELLPEIRKRYPAMFQAFVEKKPIEPQGVFWKVE